MQCVTGTYSDSPGAISFVVRGALKCKCKALKLRIRLPAVGPAGCLLLKQLDALNDWADTQIRRHFTLKSFYFIVLEFASYFDH